MKTNFKKNSFKVELHFYRDWYFLIKLLAVEKRNRTALFRRLGATGRNRNWKKSKSLFQSFFFFSIDIRRISSVALLFFSKIISFLSDSLDFTTISISYQFWITWYRLVQREPSVFFISSKAAYRELFSMIQVSFSSKRKLHYDIAWEILWIIFILFFFFIKTS